MSIRVISLQKKKTKKQNPPFLEDSVDSQYIGTIKNFATDLDYRLY